MVRVANLQDMLESGTQARAADGMSATEVARSDPGPGCWANASVRGG